MIVGTGLIIGGFSFSAISAQMWWKVTTEPPIMRPITGLDYVMFRLDPIFPIIGFSGIIILVIGIGIFFIQKKNL